MKKVTPLSPKHREFANRYLICKNGTQAYAETYLKTNRVAAASMAYDLLRKPQIRAYLEERFKAVQMSADEVMARLNDMASADLRPFVKINDDGAIFFDFSNPDAKNFMHLIKRAKTKRTRRVVGRGEEAEVWEDEYVEVELHDAQAALKLIGQKHKIFSDRMEVVLALNVEGLEARLDKVWGNK